MASYTQIGLDDIKRIVSRYDLGEVSAFENLKGGQANSSFKLTTTTGIFILSICDEKSFNEVGQLADLLRHLEEQGFPTTPVINASDGCLVTQHQGKPVLIKRYLEGSVPKEMKPKMLYRLGREIARLHRIEAPKDLPDRFAYGLKSFDEVIFCPADDDYRIWLKEKKAYLEQTIRPDLPRGLIHGDIFYDNTLFKDDELVAIIDFEEACRYYRVFDLGMCVVGACNTKGLADLEKTRILVDGYRSLRRLEPAEMELLQAFVIYGAVATSFWRFRQYNLFLPDSANSRTYLKMNAIADQIHQMPPEKFYKGVF
jgi:homoserine kinase type II